MNQSTQKVDSRSKPCFNCGMNGHFQRSCPYPRQQKHDREVQGRKASIACVETEKIPPKSPRDLVMELRLKLHEAELAAAANSTGAVIRNMTESNNPPASKLGPTITTEVEVNGISTEALVDTGSVPVSIISLDFAMIVMAKERNKFADVKEWQEGTLEKFETPQVSLKNYGGEPLDMMAQLPVRITQGEYSADIKVLVRKDAPNRLLLGTDAQPPLGYVLLRKTTDSSGEDLTTDRTVEFAHSHSPTTL